MDVVICLNDRASPINATGNSINNYLRYWEVSSYQKGLSDVREFRQAYPNISYRYFFMASKPLAGGIDEMRFEYEVIEPMIEIGMGDADTVVKTT